MTVIGQSENNFEPSLLGLQTYDTDRNTVERIRARCLEALEIQRRTNRAEGPLLTAWRKWLEPAIALGIGAFYLAMAFSSSLALLR